MNSKDLDVAVSEMVPRIWVGNAHSARKEEFLKHANINVVVNMTPDVPNYFAKGGKITYYRCPLNDSKDPSDHKKMEAFLFLNVPKIAQHYAKGDRILIHCHMGIQRSATVALCTMMSAFFIIPEFKPFSQKFNNTFKNNAERDEALKYIVLSMRSKRPQVFIWCRDINFRDAITKYAYALRYNY